MAFRTVVIANEAEIHLRRGQIVVQQDEAVSIPAEDVAVLVLEHPRIKISAATLALLASHGVATAVCDPKHMPAGVLLPHHRHSRQLAVTRLQLAATVPQKKRLWKQIVRAKIMNQASCLDGLSRAGGDKLRAYATEVRAGDTTNLEATASRYYFPRLMPGVIRHSGEGIDGSLDYGYAIVRAAIARTLIAHGLYPPVGIHHDAQLNAFNLADDLLEPFRPFVDMMAAQNECRAGTARGRDMLVGVLHAPCDIGGSNRSVLTGISDCVISLTQALSERDTQRLRTPVLNAENVMWRAARVD